MLEAGTGSGPLTMALCRAVGPEGRVVILRAARGLPGDGHRRTSRRSSASCPHWLELRLGDVRDVAGTGESFDRVVLDLPEPWALLPGGRRGDRSGGDPVLVPPDDNQTQTSVLALQAAGSTTRSRRSRSCVRTWHVTARSVRPDHRMVAHTGFITVARKGLRPRPGNGGEPDPAERLRLGR